MNDFASQAQALAAFSESGSPALVSSFGRLLGLGQDEQAALARGQVRGWTIFALGVIAGAATAVAVSRRAPKFFQKLSGE